VPKKARKLSSVTKLLLKDEEIWRRERGRKRDGQLTYSRRLTVEITVGRGSNVATCTEEN